MLRCISTHLIHTLRGSFTRLQYKVARCTQPAAGCRLPHMPRQNGTSESATGRCNCTCECCPLCMMSTVQDECAKRSTVRKLYCVSCVGSPHCRGTAWYGTAQHRTAQRSAAQHSTAQHSTAQHSAAQDSTLPVHITHGHAL